MSDDAPGCFLALVLVALVVVFFVGAVSQDVGERRGRCEARGGIYIPEGIKVDGGEWYCVKKPVTVIKTSE